MWAFVDLVQQEGAAKVEAYIDVAATKEMHGIAILTQDGDAVQATIPHTKGAAQQKTGSTASSWRGVRGTKVRSIVSLISWSKR